MYEGEQAWRDVAVRYLHDGAQGHDRLWYVADKVEAKLVDDLTGLPSRDAMLDSGQLRVLPLTHAYGPMQTFEAARKIEALNGEALAAVEAGYRGLRLAAEASPLGANRDDARRFAGYELLVDAMVAATPLSLLCGYDQHHVAKEAAAALRFVHPLRHGGNGDLGAGLYAEGGGRWRLSGELDLTNQDALDVALAALPATQDVHLDLGGLHFIGVAGVRSLVTLAARLTPTWRLVLHDSPCVLKRVLEVGWADVPGLEIVGS